MRPPLGLRDYEILSAKGNIFIIPDPSKGYPSKNPDSPFSILGYNWSKLLSRQTRANEILLKNSNANREQVKTNGRT
jgi:hypothetical protein